jgi:predicted XRE-type DNA-binding protein
LIPIVKTIEKLIMMEQNDLNKLGHDGDNLHSGKSSETTMATQSVVAEPDAVNHHETIVEPDAGIHPEDEFAAHTAHIADLEAVDHDALSKQKLVARLKHVLQTYSIDQVKDEVEVIKIAFYKQLKAEHDLLKQKFVDSGELEENFKAPADHDEHELKELIKQYRDKRAELNETLEEEKERNYTAKSDVVEHIKSLVNRQESLNDTFQEFRDLQQKWREIGPVPQAKVRDLWNSYNYAIESFYNYIHINKELRDLDLKKNLEVKVELCEKAEKLLLEPNIVHSFSALQKLHDQWREAGPVPKEKKDEVWDRFKEATSIINKKHQEHFEGIKDQLRQNLEAKTQLCEKAEEIVAVADKIDSPREWEDKSKALVDIQQMWKTIGFAPKKDNNKIYERFRGACDKFFEHKRDYFKDYKSEQHNNLQLKTELCLQAEALKSNTEWKKTTDEFIKIQKRWKEIGPVPRKQSDIIWKRFRAACDEFFENKSKHFHHIDDEQDQNLKLKQEIIDEVKAFAPSPEEGEQTFLKLQDYQKRWADIGHVPFKEKDRVNQEFRGLINKLFDNLNLDEFHKNVKKFGSRLDNMKGGDHSMEKMSQERNKIINKLRQLETDITLWENNIGFFAKSKNSDALIRDFNNKIESGKRNIKLLNEKLDMLDDLLK